MKLILIFILLIFITGCCNCNTNFNSTNMITNEGNISFNCSLDAMLYIDGIKEPDYNYRHKYIYFCRDNILSYSVTHYNNTEFYFGEK